MLVKPAAPVEFFRGKIGTSIVGYVSRGRQMARQWVNPADPQTSLQSIIRAYLSQIAVAWQSVTEGEAEGWDALAEQMTRTDSLGSQYTYFANNAYLVVNFYRLLNGQAITDTAPVYAPPSTPVITGVAVDGTNAIMDITHAADAAFYFARFTPPLPSERRKARINELRILSTALNDSVIASDTSPQSLSVPMQRFEFDESNYVGAWVLPLSAGYVPGTPFFLRNVQPTVE